MAFTFRNDTGGNPGVNRELTVAEFDGNTLESKDRIEALEGQTGKQIEEITWTGTSITVEYTDNTSDGPIPLPVATFNPVGAWTNSTPYAYLDVVFVPGVGTFVCMIGHTSDPPPAEFDPSQTEENSDGSSIVWLQVGDARDTDNDVAFSIMGTLPEAMINSGSDSDGADDVLIGQYVVIRSLIMEAPLSEARAFLNTTALNTNVELNITRNGITIGTIVFEIEDSFGTITFEEDVEFTLGDRVGLVLTAADGFAADLSVTLPMKRRDV